MVKITLLNWLTNFIFRLPIKWPFPSRLPGHLDVKHGYWLKN